MSSGKRLHVIIRKHGDPIEPDSVVRRLAPLFMEYSSIVISMQGFKDGELLEAIRPLTTRNIWATLTVYSGESKASEEYDEEIVIP